MIPKRILIPVIIFDTIVVVSVLAYFFYTQNQQHQEEVPVEESQMEQVIR